MLIEKVSSLSVLVKVKSFITVSDVATGLARGERSSRLLGLDRLSYFLQQLRDYRNILFAAVYAYFIVSVASPTRIRLMKVNEYSQNVRHEQYQGKSCKQEHKKGLLIKIDPLVFLLYTKVFAQNYKSNKHRPISVSYTHLVNVNSD